MRKQAGAEAVFVSPTDVAWLAPGLAARADVTDAVPIVTVPGIRTSACLNITASVSDP